MFLDTCRFCEHVNPPDAKFCNACGGALHLLPCSRCGAVNDVTATACFECHGPLPGRGNGAPEVSELPTPVEPPPALPRRHAHFVVGAAIVAVIAVAGFFGFRQASQLDAAQAPDESILAEVRGSPAVTNVVPGSAMASNMVPGRRDDRILSVSTSSAQPMASRPVEAPAVTIKSRESRQSAEPRQDKVASVPVARTKVTGEGGVAQRATPRMEPCTETVAALGLCALKPAQGMRAGSDATVKPLIARSKANDVGKAGRQEARRQESCTEGAAALGLCAARSTREGK